MNGDAVTQEGLEGLARLGREARDPGHVAGRAPERAEFRRASRSGDR